MLSRALLFLFLTASYHTLTEANGVPEYGGHCRPKYCYQLCPDDSLVFYSIGKVDTSFRFPTFPVTDIVAFTPGVFVLYSVMPYVVYDVDVTSVAPRMYHAYSHAVLVGEGFFAIDGAGGYGAWGKEVSGVGNVTKLYETFTAGVLLEENGVVACIWGVEWCASWVPVHASVVAVLPDTFSVLLANREVRSPTLSSPIHNVTSLLVTLKQNRFTVIAEGKVLSWDVLDANPTALPDAVQDNVHITNDGCQIYYSNNKIEVFVNDDRSVLLWVAKYQTYQLVFEVDNVYVIHTGVVLLHLNGTVSSWSNELVRNAYITTTNTKNAIDQIFVHNAATSFAILYANGNLAFWGDLCGLEGCPIIPSVAWVLPLPQGFATFSFNNTMSLITHGTIYDPTPLSTCLQPLLPTCRIVRCPHGCERVEMAEAICGENATDCRANVDRCCLKVAETETVVPLSKSPAKPETEAPQTHPTKPQTKPPEVSSATESPQVKSRSSKKESVVTILMVSAVTAFCLVCVAMVWFCRRRRQRTQYHTSSALEMSDRGHSMHTPSTLQQSLLLPTFETEGSVLGITLPQGEGVEGPRNRRYCSWRSTAEVGSGAFGRVYVGQIESGEELAVKDQANANKEQAGSAFAGLQLETHPNIVDLLDVVYDPRSRRLCIIMEYVRGTSLGHHIRTLGTKVEETACASYTKQLLSALAFLHSNGVLHRDLKADNVMLLPNGTVKLCDIGTLKWTQSEGRAKAGVSHYNTQVGTPNWMAPEVLNQLSDYVEVGPAADLYSLGCTVSEILNTGIPPGPIDAHYAHFVRTMQYPPENLVSGVSREAETFIAQCVNRAPEERGTAVKLLSHPFISMADRLHPTAPWLTVAEMMGRVRIKPALGKGSFGVVYKATISASSYDFVAVKQLHLDAGHSATMRERTEREFVLLRSLHHSNIVSYLGHTWRDGTCLEIFMEFLAGGSVRSLLHHGPLPEHTIRSYTTQVLRGLHYLHTPREGPVVIHRDIKADNLLLSADRGVVKLSDFGCSKLFGVDAAGVSGGGAHTCVGTRLWMAPEVLRQRGDGDGYGTRSDIWSLGCTLIEMLGATPWKESEHDSERDITLRALTGAAPPPLPAATALLEALMRRCLSMDPSERANAAELLEHPFIVETPDLVE